MDSQEFKSLYEAYTAVYDEDLRNELEEMSDEFAGIEDLTDEEINAVVEETIDEMLDQGYEFDELEGIFEEVISEMNPYAPAGSKAAKQYAKSTSASKKDAERAKKIANVKGSVKSVFDRVKDKVKSKISKAKETGKEAKFQTVDKKFASYANKRNLHPAPGSAARSKDPAKRRALRAKVVSDIGQRVKSKVGRGVDRAKTAAAGVASAAASAPGAAKSAFKSGLAKAAKSVSRKARNVARRLGEEVDVYDVILSHLLDEGYADSVESAEKIMVSMSEEWRTEIIESKIH